MMIFARPLEEQQLSDRLQVESWATEISNLLETRLPGISSIYDISAIEDAERHIFLPEVTLRLHGMEKIYTFRRDFFSSGEYRSLIRLGKTLDRLLEAGAYVKRGEKTEEVSSFDEAVNWLIADAMKGHYLQRYKGLGEMNPDQLWETTMDPENRRMLQVTIEDAIGADQLFTTLMGDQVDPRREFIEANALSVDNLDI